MNARFIALARSFPVLEQHAPGIYARNIDLNFLDAWASHSKDAEVISRIIEERKGPFPGPGAVEAARFILGCWASRVGEGYGEYPWKVGAFCPFRALAVWDHQQLAAFQAWAANPWRP